MWRSKILSPNRICDGITINLFLFLVVHEIQEILGIHNVEIVYAHVRE